MTSQSQSVERPLSLTIHFEGISDSVFKAITKMSQKKAVEYESEVINNEQEVIIPSLQGQSYPFEN
jgi:hypothetical protein